jgi:hypothetical protein
MPMSYGIDRFLQDMVDIGYSPENKIGSDNQNYAVFRDFEIQTGRFQGRIIDLGIPVPNDYPRLIGSSIHIKTNPQLIDYCHIPNVVNVIQSALGTEWRYWSFSLQIYPENTAQNLMSQIHGIFQRV